MNARVIRLNIIVEGQTEEAFVRDILGPHLNSASVFVSCRRVETSRRKEKVSGQLIVFRGDIVNYAKLRNDVLRWATEDRNAILTTMIDLYGLPADFPDLNEGRKKTDAYEKVACLEQAFSADVDLPNFIPISNFMSMKRCFSVM